MTSTHMHEIEADFVIIGGGTAGCIVATRLAEYGFQTLLISSGSNDTENPLMNNQSRFGQLFKSLHFRHFLPSSQPGNLNHQFFNIIVWNTLGGNSINGGGMERLTINDWKHFVDATGDQSFSYEHMCKYYKMVENFLSNGPSSTSELHGNNGPIQITQVYDSTVHDIWKNVADELNETFSMDLAGTTEYGFSFEPSSFKDGSRSWSANAYLIPGLAKYSNLKVITGATATKLELNEKTKQIERVLFITTDGAFIGIARKEYILSAGAFFSPHLLMLSGIGDPDILLQNSIPVKHVLKQVGKNLMDSGRLTLEYEAENLSFNGCIPVALVNTSSLTTNTNSNTFFVFKKVPETKRLLVMIYHNVPKYPVGSISLHNANPLKPPNIVLDYLQDESDLNTYVNSIQYLRKIMSTNTLEQFGPFIEISPGPKEVDLFKYVKEKLEPGQHFIGTCSMGRNAENSVVDNHFKVHGTHNLRVIDGSVFPKDLIDMTGPCLTIYALAEKAADIIRQQHSQE